MSIATVPVSSCPLCQSRSREAVHIDVADRVWNVAGLWSYFSCSDCGAVYQDPRPANLLDGYPEKYGQHEPPPPPRLQYGGTASSLRAWIRSAVLRAHGYEQFGRSWTSRILGRLFHGVRPLRTAAFQGHVLLPRARSGGTLVDVGCGNGRFLGFAQLLGWRVIGIEPDPESAALARALTAAPVYPSFENAPLEEERIDVITLHHVLEHAADPRSLLTRARSLLRPNGMLGVVVPDWQVRSRHWFGTDWTPLEPARHLVMFDRKRLPSLLAESGFDVRVMTGSWLRDASIIADSWRLRSGRALPAPIGKFLTFACFVADALVRRGGSEIVVWAYPTSITAPDA